MMTFKYNDVMRNLIFLFISVFISFFVSINSSNYKERNDLIAYSNYYNCLNCCSNSNCSSLIGNPVDILFSYTAMFSKYLLSINDFYIFIFLYSFCIIYFILYFVSKISPFYIVSITFLLTDFRFYEYASNILRVGLSIVLLLSVFNYIVKKRNFSFLYKILPSLAHVTALIPLVTPRFKINIYFLFISFIIFFVLSFYFDIIYESLRGFLPSMIVDKTYFYYNLAKTSELGYSIPLHYLFIIFLSIVMRNKINTSVYIYSFNIVWVLFLLSLILHSFKMEYRMFAIMPVFLSILLAYQIKYLLEIKKNIFYRVSIVILLFLFFLLLFYKNFNEILGGLS
jgi:hypothetical protein